MPNPAFAKSTIETLAKRARFQCSNPDCGVQTVGPNSDPTKATTIGEAAHIMGAQLGSARYDAAMSDATRGQITNGIWLCRNCHGQIDRDAEKYPAELLFTWRKNHESRVACELGTSGDRIRYEAEMAGLEFLSGYPPIIQRIAIDKPDGWEWRFVAELMRYLNKPQFKRLKNLQNGHYYAPQDRVKDGDFLIWMRDRLNIMQNITPPLVGLMKKLNAGFGRPGVQGDIEEMYDACVLTRDALARAIDLEESLRFANVPEEGAVLKDLFVDVLGKNIVKFSEIPDKLDEVVAMVGSDHGGTPENPTVIELTLTFDLPPDLDERFSEALREYRRKVSKGWKFW